MANELSICRVKFIFKRESFKDCPIAESDELEDKF